MYNYGKESLGHLATCHPTLQRVANAILNYRDAKVTQGHRPQEDQDMAYRLGYSKTPWPKSKHNSLPSIAMDIYPHPTPTWAMNPMNAKERRLAWSFWVEWGSWVVGFAAGMGVTLRWGYDWDRDHDLHDTKFYDGPHFELVEEK